MGPFLIADLALECVLAGFADNMHSSTAARVAKHGSKKMVNTASATVSSVVSMSDAVGETLVKELGPQVQGDIDPLQASFSRRVGSARNFEDRLGQRARTGGASHPA